VDKSYRQRHSAYFNLELNVLIVDGNARQKTLDVSIGKAVYTSRFYLGSGNRAASITCKIRQVDSQPLFQTLQLGFGMRDNNTTGPPVVVNVYLDGQAEVSDYCSDTARVFVTGCW